MTISPHPTDLALPTPGHSASAQQSPLAPVVTLNRLGLTADYMRLDRPARLRIPTPICAACEIQVRTEDDMFVCESCGTGWPIDEARDDAVGALYEDWSGENLGDRATILIEHAWRYAHLMPGEREERAAADEATLDNPEAP